MTDDAAIQLSTILPFNSNYINFQQITKFTNAYAALTRDPQMQSMAQQVQTSIKEAADYLNTGMSPITGLLSMTTEKFKALAKQGNQAKLLANYLYTVISYAGSMYQDFITNYGQKVADAGGNTNAMQQQIQPGGPQPTNVEMLDKMRQLL